MVSKCADRRRWVSKCLSAAALAALGLLVLNCEHVVPRNSWDRSLGPAVPHKNFPGDCNLCHTNGGGTALREEFAFDHEKATGHRLEGAHARAVCLRCHNDRGPVKAYVARGCGGCHPDPHKGTLGLDCTRCHEQMNWRPAGLIAEHARTRFPLFGVHAAVPCDRCHERATVGDYRGTPVQCDLCHRDDLARATNPDHQASGWTRSCERCHTPSDWTRAHFAHTFFPLTGGHAGLECNRCHTSGIFGPIPSDCYSCHRADYEGAPGHVASGYSHDCTRCHSTAGWSGAYFSHSFFPLTGAHAGLRCTQCHTSGTFGPIPSDCYSCHQDDYQRAPNHAALGFPHDCRSCHSTSSFAGARFNHPFPLSGNHSASCTTCHNAGSTQTFTCLVCHAHTKTDMDNKHSGRRGYSYDSEACLTCHPNGQAD